MLNSLLQNELRKALEAKKSTDNWRLVINPNYQSIHSVKTGEIESYEVLQRLTDKYLNIQDLIGVAEKTGLIKELDLLNIQLAVYQSKRNNLPRLNVNLSLITLGDTKYFAKILSILKGEKPKIGIQITETESLYQSKKTKEKLEKLKKAGVYLALDGFKTGYSNVTNFRELPFDSIKLDRSFVLSNNQDLLSRVVFLLKCASKSVLSVVVEGVETGEDLKLSQKIGANLAQGGYFSKPVSIGGLLKNHPQ
jgi:EAL domain-containing protein (putative c-di-GMP-specific phosphodiesterase class I)